MKKLVLAALLAGTTLSTGAVQAQDNHPGVTLTPGIGYYFFDDGRDVEDDTLLSLALGYQFDSPWALELVYLQADSEIEDFDIDVDHDQYRLDALYHFNRSGDWQPYLAGGIGQGEFEVSAASFEQDETMFNLGGGVRYFLNDNLAIRSDIRSIYGDEDDTFDVALTFGLNILFGGSSKPASKPVASEPVSSKPSPTPLPAKSKDTDGDGVVDGSDQCPSTPAGVPVNASGCPLDSDSDGIADYQDQCPNTSAGAKVDDKGCYQELLEDKEVRLNVQFANNSDVVRDEYLEEVEQVAQFMRQYVNTSVIIEGHTDDRGAASYNQSLSERRAKAVAAVLVDRFGIATNRVSAIGYGEERPLVTNDTAPNRAKNRRVVAVVTAQVKSIVR